eukprot:6211623-Amphidinium_carterae.1
MKAGEPPSHMPTHSSNEASKWVGCANERYFLVVDGCSKGTQFRPLCRFFEPSGAGGICTSSQQHS